MIYQLKKNENIQISNQNLHIFGFCIYSYKVKAYYRIPYPIHIKFLPNPLTFIYTIDKYTIECDYE